MPMLLCPNSLSNTEQQSKSLGSTRSREAGTGKQVPASQHFPIVPICDWQGRLLAFLHCCWRPKGLEFP